LTTRTQLRTILARPGLTVWPGAYDGLSAKLIERAGFEVVGAGGYAAIGSMLGEADLGQSNVRDYADHYARLCGAVEIPVYVDADTGFGGPHNVRQVVRAFEAAGVSGLFFSDQEFPNQCGYLPGKRIAPVEEMLARIAAALDARNDPELLIVARTDVYASEGLDAAIERCQLFIEAGADAAKPQGVDRIDEIERVIAEVPGPHLATLSQAAGPPKVSLAELDAAGVAAVTLPSATLFAAAEAVRRVLHTVAQDGSLEHVGADLMLLEDYYDVVGLSRALANEERYDLAATEVLRQRSATRP
jgi:methylisocitrate lyase